MAKGQYELILISHRVDGGVIDQRAQDGYVNATAMCRAAGKLFNDYSRLNMTRGYLMELVNDTGIPVSTLIQQVRGYGSDQATWVHPNVAIHLAQWLSPRFAVQVSKWVQEWMTGQRPPSERPMPYHLRRYVQNRGGVPEGHFSILVEMTLALIAPMEEAGYTLPEKMLPDISMGKIFSRWLRERLGIDTSSMPTYQHRYEDGRVIEARAYPEQFLPHFRKHLREEWIPNRAMLYFTGRDPKAVGYLESILPKSLPPNKQ